MKLILLIFTVLFALHQCSCVGPQPAAIPTSSSSVAAAVVLEEDVLEEEMESTTATITITTPTPGFCYFPCSGTCKTNQTFFCSN